MAESAAAIAPFAAPEGRRHDRTHMFVAATLYSPPGSGPVHVRNMSNQGALIEGAVLPDVGTEVKLRRGALEAGGTVVWKAGRKAGVAFSASVQVAGWMQKNPPSHQAQVDEMVRALRTGATPKAGPTPSSPLSMEVELRALKLELEQLERGLTGDMNVIASHPEIQLLDIALQRVGRLLA